jgi:hypothetical protein
MNQNNQGDFSQLSWCSNALDMALDAEETDVQIQEPEQDNEAPKGDEG